MAAGCPIGLRGLPEKQVVGILARRFDSFTRHHHC